GRRHAGIRNALRDSRRSVDKSRRNILEKARRQVQVGAPEQMSPERVKQVETILRPGHADIREAPLFFELLGRVEAPAVREKTLLHPQHEDNLKLEAVD